MLRKTGKPLYKKLLIRGAAVAFVLEAAAFGVSYWGWSKLNTDRDFRYQVRENYPLILETYYKIGETLGDTRVRQLDLEYWKAGEFPSNK